MLDLGQKVKAIGKFGTISHQLGKETDDPNEEIWYVIKFDDGSVDHCAESEIEKV